MKRAYLSLLCLGTLLLSCTQAESLSSSHVEPYSSESSSSQTSSSLPESEATQSESDTTSSIPQTIPSSNQEEEKTMHIHIGEQSVELEMEDNSSVTALLSLLEEGDITYSASDYGGFEKVGSLGHTLPTNHSRITTSPGDVVLYQNDQIVIFYGSNTWEYTLLGRIKGLNVDELASFLKRGEDIEVRLSLR